MDQNVLVGTTDGLYEVDGGQPIQKAAAGHEVTSLAKGDSGWWAIIDRREVWHSGADGAWTAVASVETLRANCLLPAPDGLLLGASEAHLFTLQGETLEPVRSFEKVEGRKDWYTPWGGAPDVRTMATDPAGALYVNVHVGGVVRSVDGGKSWEPIIDVDADVHQVLFDPESGQLLAAAGVGLAASRDCGKSWQFDTEGLHGTYLRAVAVAGGTVLVTASTGPRTKHAAVYRKAVDGNKNFERCQRGLPEWFSHNIDTFCLTASGSRVAFGTSEGSAFVSSDEGQSWIEAAQGLPPVKSVALNSQR